ncbi:MAG: ligase-associated DNA damage response endonuclease PdeM [Ignavibacteriaceae bacterium]|nr:ligase-associated DNA damage response endonuclease PdeM [Ignavibacteriaceae bacterium]
MLKTEINNTEIYLLPERAVFMPDSKILFLSDLHLGKTTAFRSAGISVPETNLISDLERLTLIINSYKPEKMIILGDLFHARQGKTKAVLETVSSWRLIHKDLEITLVEGNHDKNSGKLNAGLNITTAEEPHLIGNFACSHYPPESAPEKFTLCGHIHPAVRLYDRRHGSAVFRCFHLTKHYLLLPAFGSFTGTHKITPAKSDRIFVIADDQVLEAG